jgi:hypothetical protein
MRMQSRGGGARPAHTVMTARLMPWNVVPVPAAGFLRLSRRNIAVAPARFAPTVPARRPAVIVAPEIVAVVVVAIAPRMNAPQPVVIAVAVAVTAPVVPVTSSAPAIAIAIVVTIAPEGVAFLSPFMAPAAIIAIFVLVAPQRHTLQHCHCRQHGYQSHPEFSVHVGPSQTCPVAGCIFPAHRPGGK